MFDNLKEYIRNFLNKFKNSRKNKIMLSIIIVIIVVFGAIVYQLKTSVNKQLPGRNIEEYIKQANSGDDEQEQDAPSSSSSSSNSDNSNIPKTPTEEEAGKIADRLPNYSKSSYNENVYYKLWGIKIDSVETKDYETLKNKDNVKEINGYITSPIESYFTPYHKPSVVGVYFNDQYIFSGESKAPEVTGESGVG